MMASKELLIKESKPAAPNYCYRFTLGPLICVLLLSSGYGNFSNRNNWAPGVTAELLFNEGSGTTTTDASGNGHIGTLVNGPLWTAGKYGQAISFDGTNDYVSLADHSSFTLDPLLSYTWSAWIKNNNFNEWSTIWSQTIDANNFFYFYAHTTSDAEGGPVTNGISVYWFAGGNKLSIHSNNNVLVAGQWSHVAITYNGAQAQSSRFTIFVNGVDITNRSDINSVGVLTTLNPNSIRVGANQPYGEYFNGSIDEVRYYQRLLSQAEIQSDMNSGNTPDNEPPAINITVPAQSATVSGTINVTAGASDNVAVTGVQFLLDGANLQSEDLSAPYTLSWNTAATSNGSHTLAARARDAAGNITTSSTITITVNNVADNTPPQVSITTPGSGAVVSSLVTVSASVSDNVSVAGVQFQLDGVNLGSEDVVAPYSISWNTTTATNGVHTLSARARDASDNTAVSSILVTVQNNNLVAAYSFNENSGTTANDNSENNNHGSLNGGPIWVSTGKFGSALRFDGSNDLVNIIDANSLDLRNGMTLEAWVNPSSLTGYKTVISKENGSSNLAYSLSANNNTSGQTNQRPNSRIRIGSSTRTVTGTSKLPLNAWTHIASTYDGASLRLFVNGVQVSSLATTGNIVATTNMLRIGGSPALGNGQYFAGLIDEVRIYNRALNATEIQADMITPIEQDKTSPTVNLTAPLEGANLSGTVNITANAEDNIGVAGVQFLLDGENLGSEDITTPYSVSWNTETAANGPHALSARVRDAAGNTATAPVVNINVSPDFSFTVITPTRSVEATGNTDFRIYVAYLNGFTTTEGISLSVSGLPQNATGEFLFNPMSHQGETELLVNTANAPMGTYILTLSAVGGGITHTQQATLNITAASDFGLTASPSIQNVTTGNATTFTINLTETNDFTNPVTLSVQGLPSGTTASFNPATPTPAATSSLTLTTSATTPPGTYALTVTGSSGTTTRSTPITLTVTTAESIWTVESIGSTGVQNNTVRVGALQTDGKERVYVGTISTGRVLEYSWNGTSWSGAVDVGGSPTSQEIHDCTIGPGRGDGKDRLYIASYDFNIYEIWHDATGWHQLTVGNVGELGMHTAVGIGRNDGVTRLYAASTQQLFEFTWNGTNWTKVLVGNTPGAHGVIVGKARNDGNNYVYVASISSGNFEARWTGTSWTVASMGDAGDARGIDVGVGRNDGLVRVYSALYDGRIREFTWSGTNWTFINLPSSGTQNVHAYVVAGRNDNINRIYTSNGNGKVLEYSWNGSSWSVYNMGGGSDYMYGLHYGRARNDGITRFYSADRGSVNRVYEFTWRTPLPVTFFKPQLTIPGTPMKAAK